MTAEVEQFVSSILTGCQGDRNGGPGPGTGLNIYLTVPREEKIFLSEDEAIAFCNIGKTSFRHAVALKLIPHCIFPGSSKKLFHREDLEKAVRSNRKKGLQSDRTLG